MTKIENLNHAIRKDINFVFIKKFVIALVQELNEYLMNLRKNVNKLICIQNLDSQFLKLNRTLLILQI